MGALLPGMFKENPDTSEAFNNYFKDEKFDGKNDGKCFSVGKQKR